MNWETVPELITIEVLMSNLPVHILFCLKGHIIQHIVIVIFFLSFRKEMRYRTHLCFHRQEADSILQLTFFP